MPRFTLVTSLPKFGHTGLTIIRKSTWNPSIFAATTLRPIQISGSHPEGPAGICSSASDVAKQGNEGIMGTAGADNNVKDKAYSTAEHATGKTKEMAGKMWASAQDISQKAKKTMQAALDSAEDTAQNAEDHDKAGPEEATSKKYVQDNAETVKNSMNTKQSL